VIVADELKPGRARPVPERFEVFESDLTAHLTEEQKGWKASKLRPATERFAEITPEVVWSEETERLNAVIAGLSDGEREALVLRLQGRSPAEVAAQLGIPADAVGGLVVRALQRLGQVSGRGPDEAK
jgi:RNA polymerase sigma factor (sigma-70 family)